MSGITDALTGAVGDAGVYAVFALMALDAVFPAASEVVMLYAGALAAGAFPGHQVELFGATFDTKASGYVVIVLAGALGYWVGSIIGWAIGRYGGYPLVERHGRWLHLTPENLDRAEVWFARHGDAAVFWSRMVPVVRSFIAIPAGVARMRFGPYALYSFLGNLVWCLGFAGAGLALGTGWAGAHDRFRYIDYLLVGLIVAAAAFLVIRARKRRQRRGAPGPTDRAR